MNCLIWKQANSAVEIFNVESWCEINRISKPEQNHSFVHCDPSLVFVLPNKSSLFRCFTITENFNINGEEK